MNKIVAVAIREFLETVRTRAFLFGVIIMPLLITGFIFGGERLTRVAERETLPPRRIAIVDEHGGVYPALAAQLAEHNVQNPNRPFEPVRVEGPAADPAALAPQVDRGEYYAYIVIPRAAVDADAETTLARRDNQLAAGRTLSEAIRAAVVAVRLQTADPPVDLARIERLQRRVGVSEVDVRSGTRQADDKFARLLTPFVFMFLIYMGTFGISMGLLTSVLEEKSNRVIEVLLAAVSPTQLMAGKIIGTAAVGLVMLAIWGGVGYASARTYNLAGAVTVARLGYVLLYFIPGFLFMAALLAAVGSVCNTLKEAQSMSSPLTILNIVPLLLWFQLSQNPGSMFAVALSFIPPITPFVMILRICADPDTPLWQIAATLAVLWASVIAMIWAAGKVFRIGVLMYGKPPTLKELARWVRYT
jgi:ABC-2 type transport system permease protein